MPKKVLKLSKSELLLYLTQFIKYQSWIKSSTLLFIINIFKNNRHLHPKLINTSIYGNNFLKKINSQIVLVVYNLIVLLFFSYRV